jgi:hypothetical protein
MGVPPKEEARMINRGLWGVNTCPKSRIPHGTLAKMPHTVGP